MATGRKLTLKARAAKMAETRQRIVQAAYALHSSVGPAQTTVSAIAARAGVQRHTVYQHFADELSLSAACTAYGLARDPQPDPATLAAIADPSDRLRTALAAQYAYYGRNEALLANMLRDAPLLQQRLQAAGLDRDAVPAVVRDFITQPIRVRGALVTGWRVPDTRWTLLQAVLGLALDFSTWRRLVRDEGLTDAQAIAVMAQLVEFIALPPDASAGG